MSNIDEHLHSNNKFIDNVAYNMFGMSNIDEHLQSNKDFIDTVCR